MPITIDQQKIVFSSTLIALLDHKQISQSTIIRETGISRSSLYDYLDGYSLPNEKITAKMSELFDVPANDLITDSTPKPFRNADLELCISKLKNADSKQPAYKTEAKLSAAMKFSSYSIKELSKTTNITLESIKKYVAGAIPNEEDITKISKVLNVDPLWIYIG